MVILFSFLGGSHPEEINCLTVNEGLVFTGCRNVVHAFSHGRQVNMKVPTSSFNGFKVKMCICDRDVIFYKLRVIFRLILKTISMYQQ